MAYKKLNLGSSRNLLSERPGCTFLCLLVLWVFNTTPLCAQATQSIQGLVTDASGAIIAGAKVTITNEGMGVSQTVTTNETGNYNFPTVLVGNYDVKCEMQGFKTESVKAVRVETGAQVRQNFQLPVGEITETVEVSAAAVALNTENPTVGGVIENKRIVELPLNGRNVTQLAVLVPGVQFGERTGRGDGLGGFPIPGSGFSVSANGQREIHQVVSLDGVDAKDPRIHITNFVPSIEAIEEFKIQTNAYSAEYGFGGGAVTSITMKSGTNAIHGTLFEFLRNEALDAENYFLNFELAPGTARKPKDKFRRNQFGLVVSGPLIKNKTFWSFNWESRRDKVGSLQTAVWPLDAFRRGDFSELLTGTINPATGRLFRAPIIIYDPVTGDPFPNNIIPQNRLHPGALNVLEKYVPKAQFRQADPLDFTAREAVDQPTDTNTYFGRVDHYFSDRDRVFGRIALDRSGRTSANLNPNLPVFVDSDVTNLATSWVHTFSQSMINDFRVGFNVSNDLTFNPRTDDESFSMDALGIGEFRIPTDGNRKLTPREHGIPQLTGLPFTLQELTNGNGYDNMDTIQISDHLSFIKGKHNLKVGGELYRISMERGAANLEEGLLGFAGTETGYSFASFLLGANNSSQTPEGLPLTLPRANRFGVYIQDDWKVSPKLTVNLGLRFDYNGVPIDADGRWRSLDFVGEGSDVGRGGGYKAPDGATIPTLSPSAVGESGSIKLFKQDVRFFMPRIGIAYRPSDKWVFRIGGGMFDNINHMNTWTILNLMPPKSGSLIYTSVTDALPTRPVVGADGNTYQVQTRQYRAGQPILSLNDPFLTKTGTAAVLRPTNVLHIRPNTKDGEVWKWNLDIQRELFSNMALTVAYVGSKGGHLGNSVGMFNQAPPSPNTDIQSRRPYQRFYDPALPERGVQAMGNIRYLDSYGDSFYHGLQTKLDRRFSRGLALGVAYTYSKAHGDGENGGQEGVAYQDPLDRRGNRGRFRFDQTHNFVTHFVWELPGKNLPGFTKHIIGGWQTNGILSIRSGFPFNVTQGSDLNTGQSVRPDRIADGELDNPTRALWFDPQAFRRVTCNIPGRQDLCRFGTAGYNILEGPGQRNVDFGISKNFPFHERYSVQFRTEFVNAFNTPYFGDPNGIGFATTNSLVPDGTRMGELRSLRNPMRVIQFGLKFSF
jgi:carboxypeptidase family protein/TonB-dependent receptor-like protein